MGAKQSVKKGSSTAQSRSKSNRETFGWLFCGAIFLFGVVSMVSVLSYYFTWKADYSLLNGLERDNPNLDQMSYENICGPMGARIGEMLVDNSFGVIGIIIPVTIIMISLWLMRRIKIRVDQFIIISLLITILTSLSLGYVLGGGFSSFWAGAFGIEVAKVLSGSIGTFGTFIVLLGVWIGVGVMINRNFIDMVDRAGGAVYSGGKGLFNIFKKGASKVATITAHELKNEEFSEDEEVIDSQEEDIEEELEDEIVEEPTPQEEEPIEELCEEENNSDKPTSESVNTTPFTIVNSLEHRDDIVEEHGERGILLIDEDGGEHVKSVDERNPLKEFIIENLTARPIEEIQEEELQPQEDISNGGSRLVIDVEANSTELVEEGELDSSLYNPLDDLKMYKMPMASLLEDYSTPDNEIDEAEILEYKNQIEETLKNFNIPIQQIKATVGPTITLYEIIQAPGVKISKIQGLENDIAQSLKALGIRIIAPIPGRGTIGIEVPNHNKKIVSMKSAILSKRFNSMKGELPVVIGNTIQNECYVFDLAKMPHLLVAGATGQGKSVGLNAIITSLLYRKHPGELKFVMIDPKMVEFSLYKKLERHFMAKMESEDDVIITDPRKAVYTLNALCDEMEKRLKLLSQAGVRNINEYNNKFRNRRLNPQKGHFFMPYIVVVIDEFADLIMIAREVENPVMRLAQKARAIGIHLIVATQRPDVKVITGGIKANFPARIAFRVTQMIDSRTIIDQPGANQLIGRGDMLFSKDGELTRIQCALVETEEVERIVEYISEQQGYAEPYLLPDYVPESSGADGGVGSESGAAIKYDSLFTEVARAAVAGGSISTSSIQRNYEVGFNRAGRIMLQLERSGIVGRQEGAKPREILFHDSHSLEAKLQELGLF
ncbi:MAG: DNA translocase FtsK [Rikenellaceae bacterium]